MGTSAFGARSTPEAAPSHFRGVMLGTRSFMVEVAYPNQSKSHEINVIEVLKDLGSLSRFERESLISSSEPWMVQRTG